MVFAFFCVESVPHVAPPVTSVRGDLVGQNRIRLFECRCNFIHICVPMMRDCGSSALYQHRQACSARGLCCFGVDGRRRGKKKKKNDSPLFPVFFPPSTGDKNSQDKYKGVFGAGPYVYPSAQHHLLGRAEDIPVLQRAYQPSRRRTGNDQRFSC